MSDRNPNEVMQSAHGEAQSAFGEMQNAHGGMQSIPEGLPGAGEPQGVPPQKKKNNKKALIIGIVIVALIAAIIAGVAIYQASGKADPEKAEATYLKMQEAVIDSKVDPYANTIDFEALWEINEDAYAWITVPGTNINYPILTDMNTTDGYYLDVTIDGKVGLPGSLFTEKYNNIEMTDPVTVVYGHTLTQDYAGTMFTELHKYEEEAFLEEYPYFYIYLPNATLKYQVFSAVAFDDRYILGEYDIYSPEDFGRYISDLNSSMTGVINEDIEVKAGDYVVTLSTCITEYPEQRWLVNGVMVDYIMKDEAKEKKEKKE